MNLFISKFFIYATQVFYEGFKKATRVGRWAAPSEDTQYNPALNITLLIGNIITSQILVVKTKGFQYLINIV